MPGNRGTTSLKRKHRQICPMRAYDSLPTDLRAWLSNAALPWSARSVKRAYDKAMSKTGNRALAFQELDRLQARLIAKDASQIWGQNHPEAEYQKAA